MQKYHLPLCSFDDLLVFDVPYPAVGDVRKLVFIVAYHDDGAVLIVCFKDVIKFGA